MGIVFVGQGRAWQSAMKVGQSNDMFLRQR